MEFSPKDPTFVKMLSTQRCKEIFESSEMFYMFHMQSEYAGDGQWTDDEQWLYHDPLIQDCFTVFCEGYVNGLVEYYMTEKEEKESSEKRMKMQMEESDNKGEIVMDFSEYFK